MKNLLLLTLLLIPANLFAGSAVNIGTNVAGQDNNFTVNQTLPSVTFSGDSSVQTKAFSGFKVLQIVQFSTNTYKSTTSNTYQNTPLTASITPSSASSKIIVVVNTSIGSENLYNTAAIMTIKKDGTDLFSSYGGNGFASLTGSASSAVVSVPVSKFYMDSPSTTSSITYLVCVKSTDNATTVYGGYYISLSNIMLIEVLQ